MATSAGTAIGAVLLLGSVDWSAPVSTFTALVVLLLGFICGAAVGFILGRVGKK